VSAGENFCEVKILHVKLEEADESIPRVGWVSLALPGSCAGEGEDGFHVRLVDMNATVPIVFRVTDGICLQFLCQTTPPNAYTTFLDGMDGCSSVVMSELIAMAGSHDVFESGAVLRSTCDEWGQVQCTIGGLAPQLLSTDGGEGFGTAESAVEDLAGGPSENVGLDGDALAPGDLVSEGRGRGRGRGSAGSRGRKATGAAPSRRASSGSRGAAEVDTMGKLESFMSKMDKSMEEFGSRLGRLEAGQSSQNCVPSAPTPLVKSAMDVVGRPGAQGLNAVSKYGAPAPLPRQLPWGQGSGPPPARPMASSTGGLRSGTATPPPAGAGTSSTGQRAFDEALGAARQAFGSRGEVAAPAERPARPGAGKRSDLDLEAAIQSGGPNAQIALQLATLEVLERIGNRQVNNEPTLDEMLYGFGPSDSEGSDRVGKIAGSKGAAGLLQLSRAIEADPEKWSAYCERQAVAGCGALTSGLPWSMSLYGERCVKFSNVHPKERSEDCIRFGEMLSALHGLHYAGQHELVGAKLRQFLKSIEQSTQARGSWRMAWLMTGLPDPLPQGTPGTGLLHPAEFAAAAGFVREMDNLEAIARKHMPKGGPPPKKGSEKKDD